MYSIVKKLFLSIAAICFLALSGFAQKVTPETALKSYMANGDKTYQWELKDSVSNL